MRLSRIPMENVTEKLSQHLASLQYKDLPPEVVDYTKVLLLDSLGVALYGVDKKWSKIIVEYIKRTGGKGEATIWGTQFKAPKANIALANGVMIHSFELDDYHNAAKVHPGAVVIPAALATGETADIHGRQLIISLVCGYETMIRTSLGAGPSSAKNRGWHLTGICGPFGAAAAAGKIIGFGAKKMANALGLAGTQASGLFAFTADGSMSKRFHPGKAAQNGINAVELVSQGFTGPTQILEAKDGGFCKAVSDDFNLERIIYGLGENFEILKTSINPYSCCGSVHSAIDGMLQLRERHNIKTESIEEVTIGTSSVVKLQCGWDYKPESILQAQMSLQYCIAAAIQGDFREVAQISFECVMCGLCAARCPAEISQFNVALLARRVYGSHILPFPPDLKLRVKEIREGKYQEVLDRLSQIDTEKLREIYSKREQEPQESEGWEPKEKDFPLPYLR